MIVPDINQIAKEIIPDCIERVKEKLRRTILETLGFDTTWHDIKIKEGSSLIREIQATEEYRVLREQIKNSIIESMKNNPITVADKRAIVSTLRDNIRWNLEGAIKDEIAAEYTQQALDIIKSDPSVAPTLIAHEFIKRSSK